MNTELINKIKLGFLITVIITAGLFLSSKIEIPTPFLKTQTTEAQTLTCQDKCWQEHKRDGYCLIPDKADPEEGFIQQLNKGTRYCPREGESCYCKNHKAILEVNYPILELEYNYWKHLNNVFSSSNYDVFSEYDLDHLVCRANIYDQDEEDRKWIKNHPPDFEILYAWTPYSEFNSLSKLPSQHIKCNLLDSGSVECQARISPLIAKKIERGMILKCQVIPKDPYQKGIDPYLANPYLPSPLPEDPVELEKILKEFRFRSQPKGLADHLYYFFRTRTGWGTTKEQYSEFLNKSAVTDNFWEIKDRTERIGKSYWYNKDLSFSIVVPREKPWEKSILTGVELAYIYYFRRAAKNVGTIYDPWKDDKIIEIDAYPVIGPELDALTGLQIIRLGGGVVMLDPLLISDYIYLGGGNSGLTVFAHEMGHASNNSKLCDEYNKTSWEKEKKFLISCPNPFPNCCNNNLDCGSPAFCFGMPYHPDYNTPQPDYRQKTDPFKPEYYSVMGGGKGKEIYPIEAQCPLRNCR